MEGLGISGVRGNAETAGVEALGAFATDDGLGGVLGLGGGRKGFEGVAIDDDLAGVCGGFEADGVGNGGAGVLGWPAGAA